MLKSLPNLLSLIRIPLAFVFLCKHTSFRTGAILLAGLSDGLDGFLARRMGWISRSGTLIDPLTDRFFVLFIIGMFLFEGSLQPWQAAILLCRDAAVLLFGIYLVFSGKLATWRFRAIWCGKATTFLQFILLFLITMGLTVPDSFYSLFIIFGILALGELYISQAGELA